MVTVVIPLYNKVPFISRTLDSVAAQTYTDYEVVVVDDGSTDGSPEIVANHQLSTLNSKLRLIRQSNAGVSTARNRGIEEALGEFIAFLDADDEWKPDYLATQMALVEKYPKCDVFATNYEFRDEKGNVTPTIIRKLPFESEDGKLTNYFEVASCSHPPLWTSAVMVRKSAIQSIGGFPVGIKSGEDLLTWARVAAKCKIAWSRNVLAVFVRTPSDNTTLDKAQQRAGGEEYILQELLKLYDNCKDSSMKPQMKAYIIRWYKIYSILLIQTGRGRLVLSVAKRALAFGGKALTFLPLICISFLPVKTAKKTIKMLSNSRFKSNRSFSLFIKKYANKVLNKTSILLPDELFLRLRWWLSDMEYPLNLYNPKTFNEKLQWLKIHDKRPDYTKMVDKYEAKECVDNILGPGHTIPTLGVWNRFDEIDFSTLPDKFVLKATHDSGTVVICHNKKTFDFTSARQLIEKRQSINFYWIYREWPYKNVKPRIIAEQYMEDENGEDLKDYKFFCFDGEPKVMFVATDRNNPNAETKFDFYDMNFQHLPFTNGHPNANTKINKPTKFEEMKKTAALLSKGIPHVRIDLYEINGKVYFGEWTFFHWSGLTPFHPKEWDDTLGNWIKLPNRKK